MNSEYLINDGYKIILSIIWCIYIFEKCKKIIFNQTYILFIFRCRNTNNFKVFKSEKIDIATYTYCRNFNYVELFYSNKK